VSEKQLNQHLSKSALVHQLHIHSAIECATELITSKAFYFTAPALESLARDKHKLLSFLISSFLVPGSNYDLSSAITKCFPVMRASRRAYNICCGNKMFQGKKHFSKCSLCESLEGSLTNCYRNIFRLFTSKLVLAENCDGRELAFVECQA